MKLNELIEEVCVKFGTSRGEIFSQRRNKGSVTARKIIYKVLTLDGNSTTKVGRIMIRNHSSIVVGIHSIDENKDLSKYATYLYLKYREEEKVSPDIDAETAKKIMINYVRKYHNKGLSVEQISDELDLKQDTVKLLLNIIKHDYKEKKVPCYDKGTYRTIYL